MAKTSMRDQTSTWKQFEAYWKMRAEGSRGSQQKQMGSRGSQLMSMGKPPQKQMGKMALQIGADGSADEQRLAAAEVELQPQPKPQPELEPQPELSSLCSCPGHSYSLAVRTWCAARTCLYGTPIEP